MNDKPLIAFAGIRNDLLAKARAVAAGHAGENARDVDLRERYPEEGLQALRESGLCGLTVPPEYGGLGANAATAVAVVEEVAYGCPSTAALLLTYSGGVLSLAAFGTPVQRDRYLPGVARGDLSLSFALTEPHCGSDATAITSRAVRDGDEWVLNGTKAWIGNAARADLIVVAVKSDPAAGSRGISSFVVERGTPGLRVGEPYSKTGARGTIHSDLYLEDLRVPASALLGEAGRGFAQMMHSLDFVRLVTAAHALGIARLAFDAAVDYAGRREAFGRKLHEHQAVGFMLADMATELRAAQLLTHDAAAKLDAGTPIPQEAAMAKLYATEAATRIAHRAQQIHGAEGCRAGTIVERMYREARVTEIWDGTSEVQRIVISRGLYPRKQG